MPFSSYDIYDLVERMRLVQFEELVLRQQEEGFQVFIPQLSQGETYDGDGWSLHAPDFGLAKYSSGWLVVQQDANRSQLTDYLDRKLAQYRNGELLANSWWKDLSDLRIRQNELKWHRSTNANLPLEEQPHLPGEYKSLPFDGFKVLPEWGINHRIVIPILIRNEDGSFSVQVKRQDDGAYAFVNGIIKDLRNGVVVFKRQIDQVKKAQAVQLFLAEMYGNDLFAENSMSLTELKQIPKDVVHSSWETLFDEEEFKDLKAYAAVGLIDYQDGASFLQHKLILLKENASNDGMREERAIEIVSRIKCRMYQKLLPCEFERMQEQLISKFQYLTDKEEIDSAADPRNTSGEGAFVRTTPMYLLLEGDELEQMEQSYKVKPAGGALDSFADVIPIQEFFNSDLVLDPEILALVLTDLVVCNDTYLESAAFISQLHEIQQHIEMREKRLIEKKGARLVHGGAEEGLRPSQPPYELESMPSVSNMQSEPRPLSEESQPVGCWQGMLLMFRRTGSPSVSANNTDPLLSERVSNQEGTGRATRLGNCCIM